MSITLPASLAGGRYQLGPLIGKGGMAEVHTALDTRLGRTVAVKIMRSDLTNDEIFLSRFRREAHSVAQLNNPNIVSIYDSGEEILTDEHGNKERVPYLVMEYVKGQTLRAILKENGALSQRDTEQVMLGVLNALEYSHHMGIIHRDIKPGNIMISEQGIVKVMDFGIARALDDSAATMTQSQGVVGTAQYLSPEQARGETVDLRSDLYSAGCVLYEMLTGRPPFNGDSAVAIAYQHVSEVATPPSAIVPGLPTMWDSICAKAMAKDRQNRYATAAEFKNDIVAFMNGGTPVAAAFNPLSDLSNMRARKDAEQEAATVPVPTAATQAFNPIDDAVAQTQTASIAPVATQAADGTGRAARAAQARHRKKVIYGWVISVIVLAALIAAGVAWAMTHKGPEMATVPTITSQMSKVLAEEKIKAAGFTYEEKEDTDSAEAKGTFTKQSPKGGTQAKKGSTVTVWFSAGPKQVAVPDVKGKDQEEARSALENAGFKVSSSATVEDSASVPKDKVTRTDPAGGTSQAKGTSILLYISSGMTKVPDLSGKTKDEALKALQQDQKFSVTIQEELSDTVPKDSVIRTDPAAGAAVQQGSMITVTISNGMGMKDVTNLTLKKAKENLNQLGITKIDIDGPKADDAIVIRQTPPVNTPIDKNTDTVTLTTELRVPAFTPGKTTLGEYKSRLSNLGIATITVQGPNNDNAIVAAVNPPGGAKITGDARVTVTTQDPSSGSGGPSD
ncbi:Stk1 family PASTA domain-containing Ser/Thr kinase [Bifidobacterium favimelis]|uniref:non-specific serine/threonine protein kinase n=1 Tax=Bifidobacterium favimelis TaxID=3122979 RepID=A0ABU8ZQ45_9BIFI